MKENTLTKITADKIIYSKRKTIALEITPKAELILKVPAWTSTKKIESVLTKKREWISQKKKAAQDRIKNKKKICFKDGAKIFLLAKPYPLKIIKKNKIQLNHGCLEFPEKFLDNHPAKHLKKWYQAQAKEIITRKCRQWANKLNINYKTVKISQAKKRAGSCSFKNSLNFSWYLILAPEKILDYVIVHELCHVLIKDHSRNFWKRVESYLPDYKKTRNWLKENPISFLYSA